MIVYNRFVEYDLSYSRQLPYFLKMQRMLTYACEEADVVRRNRLDRRVGSEIENL
jgi:hypothetical protein